MRNLVILLLIFMTFFMQAVPAQAETLRQVTHCLPTGGVPNLETADPDDFYASAHPNSWWKAEVWVYNRQTGQWLRHEDWHFDESQLADFPNGGYWRIRELFKTVGIKYGDNPGGQKPRATIEGGVPVGVPGTLLMRLYAFQPGNPEPIIFFFYEASDGWRIVRVDDQTGPGYEGCMIHVAEKFLGYCYQKDRAHHKLWRMPPVDAPMTTVIDGEVVEVDWSLYPVPCYPVNNNF